LIAMNDLATLPASGHRRNALLDDVSVEITARDRGAATVLAAHLPQGARVHVTFLPDNHYLETVAAARALAMQGLTPVPHIAARSLADAAALADYVSRLRGEAGVSRALLIAGDLASPRGPFADSLSVLQTNELQRHGIRSVAFAGHPEGHPVVAEAVMRGALAAKLRYAAEHGLEASIVTQLCFEAAPILRWARRLRAAGVAAPIIVGAAAPTNPLMLLKFAIRCGVGASAGALTRQTHLIGQLMSDAGPERLIDDLSCGIRRDHTASLGQFVGMHFFVFGPIDKAVAWLARQTNGQLTCD